MKEIIIDEEFRLLLPKLDKDTFESLEKNIVAYGVRDPLVLWKLNTTILSITGNKSISEMKTSIKNLITSLEELLNSI